MVAVGLAGSVFPLILMAMVGEKNTPLSFLVSKRTIKKEISIEKEI